MNSGLWGWLFATLMVARTIEAAVDPEFLTKLSIDDLLDLKVSTASVLDAPWVRQPASITVFDSSSIDGAPARYLDDILEWVPGTSAGIDVFGVTSLNFRGHWAHEGKILLLVDGIPVNDLLYGDLNLQRHYPVSQIERVEVLRGAGTAKYGGNAQLAVIRVSTFENGLPGYRFHAGGNWVQGTGWGEQATLSANIQDFAEHLKIQFSAFISESPYSAETWVDTSGKSIELGDLTSLRTWNHHLQIKWDQLTFQWMHDFHESESPHGFGFERLGETITFDNQSFMLSYELKLPQEWNLRPTLLFRDQKDWHIDRDPGLQPTVRDFFLNSTQTKGNLDLTHDGDSLDLLIGLEWWKEHGFAASPGGVTGDVNSYFAGERSVDYHASSGYLQADWMAENWMFSGGVRFSHHNHSGSSTVPRVSVGYVWAPWHFKLNVGQAFREPDIEVINASDLEAPAIRPERTTSIDFELGKTFGDTLMWTATGFYVQIQDPIIYSSSTDNSSYFYSNNSSVKTLGFETEFRYRDEENAFYLNYSFYRTANTPIEIYRVAENPNVHNGVPVHKIIATYQRHLPWVGWSIEASIATYLEIYGWVYDATAVDFQGYQLKSSRLDDRCFSNLGLQYRAGHWLWDLTVFDLFNTHREYVQPYHSESTPYPGSGREIVISLEYSW